MTREEAIRMTQDCRITSLGELAHGYVIYQCAAKEIIHQIFDVHEQRIKELEEQKQGLESLLDFKLQEISVLESEVLNANK